GVRFVDLIDAGDPVEVAARYDAEGADELCFLDITASHERRPIILDVVARTAERVFMPLTVGGGVRTVDDVRALLKAGADKVSINTAAVGRPDFVREAAERFGTQCVVVAVDARRRVADAAARGWEVYTHGGRTPTGLDAVDWAAAMEAAGAGEILLTSMDRDGTGAAHDRELTRAIVGRVGMPGLVAVGRRAGHPVGPRAAGRRAIELRRLSRGAAGGRLPHLAARDGGVGGARTVPLSRHRLRPRRARLLQRRPRAHLPRAALGCRAPRRKLPLHRRELDRVVPGDAGPRRGRGRGGSPSRRPVRHRQRRSRRRPALLHDDRARAPLPRARLVEPPRAGVPAPHGGVGCPAGRRAGVPPRLPVLGP